MGVFDDLNKLLGPKSAPAPPDNHPAGSPSNADTRRSVDVISTSDVTEQRFSSRFLLLLGIVKGAGFTKYLSWLFPALAINEFSLDDYQPDDMPYWASNALAAGGAGTFARIGLVNPPNSGVIAIVSYMAAFAGAAMTIGVRQETATDAAGLVLAGGPFNANSRDSRVGGVGNRPGGNRVLVMNDNLQAVVGGVTVSQHLASATLLAEWGGNGERGIAVIGPGHSLILEAETAVQAMTAEFRWRERAI